MAEKLHLEIVTPERKILEADVEQVQIPGLDGELGILPGHTEMISQLKPAGLLSYSTGSERGEISISGGFVEVNSNQVIVLADLATKPEDINLAEALELKASAERQLQKALTDPDADILRATIELERASLEVQLAEKPR
jgi:F-type H+-transporting ATPase subunit epsilon